MVVDRLTIKNYRIPQTVYSPVWGFLFYNKKVVSSTLLLIKPLKGESLGLISRCIHYIISSFYPHNYVTKCVFCIQPQIVIFRWLLSAIMFLVFNIDFRLTKSSDSHMGWRCCDCATENLSTYKADDVIAFAIHCFEVLCC
jgi:hypothetical protein